MNNLHGLWRLGVAGSGTVVSAHHAEDLTQCTVLPRQFRTSSGNSSCTAAAGSQKACGHSGKGKPEADKAKRAFPETWEEFARWYEVRPLSTLMPPARAAAVARGR